MTNKTIIHINKNIIQKNIKRGTKLPVCRVELKGKTKKGEKFPNCNFHKPGIIKLRMVNKVMKAKAISMTAEVFIPL